VLSGRGLCDELITRPEESYRLCCVVCDLETSRICTPCIYDISHLRVKHESGRPQETAERRERPLLGIDARSAISMMTLPLRLVVTLAVAR
jgi:hypothetical protein